MRWDVVVSRHRRKGLVRPLEEQGLGPCVCVSSLSILVTAYDADQLPWIGKWQRLEQHAVDNEKDDEIGADSKRQDHYGHDAEAWRFSQDSQGVLQIVEQILE